MLTFLTYFLMQVNINEFGSQLVVWLSKTTG